MGPDPLVPLRVREQRMPQFTHEFALSCTRLPHRLPLCIPADSACISYCCIASIYKASLRAASKRDRRLPVPGSTWPESEELCCIPSITQSTPMGSFSPQESLRFPEKGYFSPFGQLGLPDGCFVGICPVLGLLQRVCSPGLSALPGGLCFQPHKRAALPRGAAVRYVFRGCRGAVISGLLSAGRHRVRW